MGKRRALLHLRDKIKSYTAEKLMTLRKDVLVGYGVELSGSDIRDIIGRWIESQAEILLN